jgi:hypothetical protein
MGGARKEGAKKAWTGTLFSVGLERSRMCRMFAQNGMARNKAERASAKW